MSDIPSHDEALGGSEVLSSDLLCIGCGYNLRGLSSAGRCPECGLPVERTMHDYLRFADPAWLDRLVKGSEAIVLAMLVLGLGGLILLFLVFIWPLAIVVAVLAWAICQCAVTWGVWHVTSPETRDVRSEQKTTLRNVIRFCVVGALAGAVVDVALMFFWDFGRGGGALHVIVIVLLAFAVVIASVVLIIGMLVYLRRLARRIPDIKLERSTTTAMWGVISCGGLWSLFYFVFSIVGAWGISGPGPIARGYGVVVMLEVCGTFIGLLVFGIWIFVLLARYNAAFTKAADYSRQMLASASGGGENSATSADSAASE